MRSSTRLRGTAAAWRRPTSVRSAPGSAVSSRSATLDGVWPWRMRMRRIPPSSVIGPRSPNRPNPYQPAQVAGPKASRSVAGVLAVALQCRSGAGYQAEQPGAHRISDPRLILLQAVIPGHHRHGASGRSRWHPERVALTLHHQHRYTGGIEFG